MKTHKLACALGVLAFAIGGCATDAATAPPTTTTTAAPAAKALPPGLDPGSDMDPFPSTYHPLPSRPTAIVNAHILTGTGDEIASGTVLIKDGKIEQVGANIAAPAGYDVVDAQGQWVTPGIIDGHSHMGVYAGAGELCVVRRQRADRSEHRPGVGGTFGVAAGPEFQPRARRRRDHRPDLARLGQSVRRPVRDVRNVPARTEQEMKFPGAPYGLKMACGENPKRVYGSKGRAPSTRMGNVAGYRAAWIRAADYERKWDDYHAKAAKGEKADPPTRDLQLDTLAGVLRGQILVENHCYRADEMANMIDISKEFGYHVAGFHHAVEAYKIRDMLKANDICVATWANWWGFKMEAYDATEDNAALLQQAGVCTVIKSDDPDLTQRLNQEAAEAMSAGRRDGIDIPEKVAIEWITRNPAKMIGILDQTGTLEPGKRADVVIWNHDPFSIYALTQKVYIDGAVVYDRHDPRFHAEFDFEIGHPGEETR